MNEDKPILSSKPKTGEGLGAGSSEDEAGANPPATPEIDEDRALAMLQSGEVTSTALAELARKPVALKSRKVVLALVTHLRTPRHISIPLLRRMFAFDLMQVTLTPAVAADIKRAAENQILLRLELLSVGEKISLARRSSGRVAAELLRDNDVRIVTAALDNTRLVETGVVTALVKPDSQALLFKLVSEHPKWSNYREVQIALMRSEKTPVEQRQKIAALFSAEALEQPNANSSSN